MAIQIGAMYWRIKSHVLVSGKEFSDRLLISSFAILCIFQPRKREMKNPPKGMRRFEAKKSAASRKDFPKRLMGTAPCERAEGMPAIVMIIPRTRVARDLF